MKSPALFAMVSGGLLLVGIASAQSVKVIANSSVRVDAISPSELRSVFLEEKSSLPGSGHVEPVLAKGGPAHEAFLKQVLGRSDSDLQLYYRSLAFTGRGAVPRTLDSDEAVCGLCCEDPWRHRIRQRRRRCRRRSHPRPQLRQRRS